MPPCCIGSDILGSIRIPAAFCGLVGFRPASAAVDKADSWPEIRGETACWLSAGPITRSVRDARLVYEVLSGMPLPPVQPAAGRLWLPDPLPLAVADAPIAAALAAARGYLLEAGLAGEATPIADLKPVYRDVAVVLATELGPQLKTCLTDSAGNRFSVLREWLRRLLGRPSVYAGVLQLLTVAPLMSAGPERFAAAAGASGLQRTAGADHFLQRHGPAGRDRAGAVLFRARRRTHAWRDAGLRAWRRGAAAGRRHRARIENGDIPQFVTTWGMSPFSAQQVTCRDD